MILALRRRLPEFLELQRAGQWERNVNTLTATGPSPIGAIADLDGATVLILGHGSIGRAVGARLAAVRGAHRRRRGGATRGRPASRALSGLPDEPTSSSFCVPLTAATERIVDAAFLARMKPGALLVNASRGRMRRHRRARRRAARRARARRARRHRPRAAARRPPALDRAGRADHAAHRGRRAAHGRRAPTASPAIRFAATLAGEPLINVASALVGRARREAERRAVAAAAAGRATRPATWSPGW